MPPTPTNKSEPNRRDFNGRYRIFACLATLLTITSLPGRRHMRVKLCNRCPYTPHDLADHYDPDAALHACASCDREQATFNQLDHSETQWRRKCVTTLNRTSTTQQSVAPFATGSLASYATIPGEPPFVQGSASITSRPAAMATTDGCGDFAPPDDARGEKHAEFPWRSLFRDKESAF